jgi:hypothetical protein
MLGRLNRRASALLLASGALTFGCSGPTDLPPVQLEPARLAISANVSATTIQTMVVTVTGPGITIPLVFNLPINDQGIATGSIAIPTGSSRKIELDAFDVRGIKTHHGERTIDEVKPGPNLPLSIVLLPLAGDQPVTASLGTYTVTVTPNPGTVLVGQANAVTFTAVVRDKDNAVVAIGPGELRWATTNPAFFSVASHATDNNQGVVTGIMAGSGEVVATYNGFAGLAAVTVTP